MTYTDKLINLDLIVIPDYGDSEVNLSVHVSSGGKLYTNLFAFQEDKFIFISELSIDDAYSKYLQYAYDNGILKSERECNILRSKKIHGE